MKKTTVQIVGFEGYEDDWGGVTATVLVMLVQRGTMVSRHSIGSSAQMAR